MKAISFMRLRVVTDPKELLAVYKRSELSVEQKYDGHKAEAAASRRGVKIYSRNGIDITARVPSKVEQLEKLIGPTCSTVLGEMIYVEDGKQEVGLDQWEGRRWLGLKRHLILTSVSYLFLARVRKQLRKKKSGPHRVPGAHGGRIAGAELVA